MTFKQAQIKREENPSLEHELRAAKIVSWFVDHMLNEEGEELTDNEKQIIFEKLVEYFEYSNDEADSIVFEIYRDMKDSQ
jgi:hypothetical protein